MNLWIPIYLVLFLGACGLTPQGDFVREAIKSYGAKAYDEGLINAESFVCDIASVGSVRRRYGKPGMADVYREFCGASGAARKALALA